MLQKKVCMVGVHGVGKTSLVRRFVHSRFSESYLATVGVKIDRKEVHVGGRQLQLMLWDLAGRDDFEDVPTSYLRGSSGLLLVVDGTRRATYDQIFDLRERALGVLPPEVPFVVALNKIDLEGDWRLEAPDLDRLHELDWPHRLTSAKTGAGVEETFQALARRMVGD